MAKQKTTSSTSGWDRRASTPGQVEAELLERRAQDPGPGFTSADSDAPQASDQQRRFAEEYIRTGHVAQAARLAGYKNPEQSAYLLNSPAVREIIYRHYDTRALAGCQLGMDVIENMARDSNAPAHVRVDCAKYLCRLGGLEARAARMADQDLDKPLHEMTLDELAALVR